MKNSRGPGETASLPTGLTEALAFYDALAERVEHGANASVTNDADVAAVGSRDEARKLALSRFSDWAEQLRDHFRLEDCLLGVTDSPFDSTHIGLPADTADGTSTAAASGVQTHFLPRYLLGVGGQGEVWLAHDPELDRFVALKVIKENQRGSQSTAARFWREAELTGKLEHPNIVPVYAAGRTEHDAHSPYYVMRVFGNRHLLRAITAFHARPRTQQDWQLLEALKSFHEQRTPENDQRLQQALQSFAFDETQECDRDLKAACEALRRDPAGQSGRSLQEAINTYHSSGRQPSDLRELLNRFIDVCNAVAYAHSRGVIHRDLKPQNVMLGEFGETLVVDWGLAKIVHQPETADAAAAADTLRISAEESERDSHTQQGTIVGTLAYMPPEQAWGKVDELTAAADIYSLGGILYMLLTGQPPRTGTSKTALIESARSGQIAAPTSIQPDVSRALEAVCLKALSKSPDQRYRTAKDLAADVTRWLADEPVTAWPEPLVVRAKRWVKGHQTLVGSTAAAVLVAVITLSALVTIVNGQKGELNIANTNLTRANADLFLANEREKAARLAASDALQKSQAELELARRRQYAADMQLAQHYFREQNLVGALQMLERQRPDAGAEVSDLRGWEWYYLKSLCHQEDLTFEEHRARVEAVAWEPDESRIASADVTGQIFLWDANTGETSLSFFCGEERQPELKWDRTGEHIAAVASKTVMSDWEYSTSFLVGGPIRVWDSTSGELLLEMTGYDGDWSPIESHFAFCKDDGTAAIWNSRTGECRVVFDGGTPVTSVRYNPDGDQLAIADGAGVHVLNAMTGTVLRHFEIAGFAKGVVAWNTDGRGLAAKGYESGQELQSIFVWDVTQGSSSLSESNVAPPSRYFYWTDSGDWLVDEGEVSTRIYSREALISESLATASHYATPTEILTAQHDISISHANNPYFLHSLAGHTGTVYAVRWSPSRTRVASGGADRTVRVWSPDVHKYRQSESPDGRFVAQYEHEHAFDVLRMEFYEVEGDTSERKLAVEDAWDIRWSSDSQRAAFFSEASLFVYDVALGVQLHEEDSVDILEYAWQPHGDLLAVRKADAIELLNPSEPSTRRVVHGAQSHRAVGFNWAPDGQSLAVTWIGSMDVRWNLFEEMRGNETSFESQDVDLLIEVYDLAGTVTSSFSVPREFSPSGEVSAIDPQNRQIAFSVWDPVRRRSVILIWNIVGRDLGKTLIGSQQLIRALLWSSDRRLLASGEASIEIWSVDESVRMVEMPIYSRLPVDDGFAGSDDPLVMEWSTDGRRVLLHSSWKFTSLDATRGYLLDDWLPLDYFQVMETTPLSPIPAGGFF